MQTIFSTSHVEARHRFDYWHGVASERFTRHDAVPADRRAFRAELKSGRFGDIDLLWFEHSALRATHASHHVADADAEHLFLSRLADGHLGFEQAGQSAILEPGDLILADPHLPHATVCGDGAAMLALKVPRVLLQDRLGDPRDLLARSLRRTTREASLLSAFVATLPSHTGGLEGPNRQMAIDHLLALLARAVGRAPTDEQPPAWSAALDRVHDDAQSAEIDEQEQEVIQRLEAGSIKFRRYDRTKIRPVLERGLRVGDRIVSESLELTYLGGNRWRVDSFGNVLDEQGKLHHATLSSVEVERDDIHQEMLLRLARQAAMLP